MLFNSIFLVSSQHYIALKKRIKLGTRKQEQESWNKNVGTRKLEQESRNKKVGTRKQEQESRCDKTRGKGRRWTKKGMGKKTRKVIILGSDPKVCC